ncbi:MAG: hypothetical protein RBS80_31845, partial [Thermoguttaceae bacterium]|nr:hypothetical protein [Thermoguttaceae bacterium]
APITRKPVPSASEQEKIRRMIDELYDTAALRTSDDRQRLVGELTALAEKVEKAEERFVLLRRASELASEEGDSQRVHELVTRIADEFEVDRLSEQVSMLKDLAERATGEDQIRTLVVDSAGLIHEALETDRFDLAESLSLVVLEACQSPAGRAFFGEALEARREVQELCNEWERIQTAHRTLELSPDDAAAHTIVARWYCLVRENWDLALPHLAKSSDPKLRVLANLELHTSTEDAVAQVKLGDAWWVFVQESDSDSRPAWEARTAYWYEMAWPHITSPLQKVKVQKRLVELGRPDPELPRRDSEHLESDRPAPLPLGERRLSDLMEEAERIPPEHDKDSDSPTPEGTACKACNGKGVIYNKCPNRKCARGTVRDYRIEVVGRNPVSGQAIVQRVPVRVPCPVCGGNYIRKETCSECGGRGVK